MDNDKVAAYLTLYECLTTLVVLLAPFMPFAMEEVYQNLVRRVNGEAAFSVHLGDWPKVNEELLDEKLTNETHLVMRIVGLGRAAREKAQIKVRQPLGAMFVRVADRNEEEVLLRLSWQVLEELNIKQLHLMSDDSNMLAYTLKPQVKVLGPKYGLLLQKILAAFKALDAHGAQEATRALNETGKLNFAIDGHQIELTPDEIEVVATARPGFAAAEDRGYVVALETTITPELREEGLVRDLTHYVQDMRKRAGFNIEDHVALALYTGEDLASILRRHKKTLQSETLADTLSLVVDQPAAPLPDEVYREKISPRELKKLENFTVEVVLGRV
jgi:isoleucyl-tRNA synthetase